MTYPKCRGLLMAERHLDFCGPAARWKCVNCGRPVTELPRIDRCMVRTAIYTRHL